MINVGELTHKIVIQVKSISQDAELNSVETWMDWRTVWAKPMPRSSKEYYRLATINPEITEVFQIRYIAGVNAQQRIKFKCRYFEIVGFPINEGEQNESLLITCKGAV